MGSGEEQGGRNSAVRAGWSGHTHGWSVGSPLGDDGAGGGGGCWGKGWYKNQKKSKGRSGKAAALRVMLEQESIDRTEMRDMPREAESC